MADQCVIAKSAFQERDKCIVKVGKHDVALFRFQGEFYAFKDACPHQGHSLGRGRIEDDLLICPGHNWRFDIHTGQCVKGDQQVVLKRYAVIDQGDAIVVRDA